MKGVYAVQEGIDGTSFAAGWGSAAAIFTAIGAFVRRIIIKAKDGEITTLIQRIQHLEEQQKEERKDCSERLDHMERLQSEERQRWQRQYDDMSFRIRTLESGSFGEMRKQVQGVVSEIRKDLDEH